jgi:hypothetical protein
MKVKELKKILKEYDDDTDILIWWEVEKTIYWEQWQWTKKEYGERPLDLQDIVDSSYNWQKRIIISKHNLHNYY